MHHSRGTRSGGGFSPSSCLCVACLLWVHNHVGQAKHHAVHVGVGPIYVGRETECRFIALPLRDTHEEISKDGQRVHASEAGEEEIEHCSTGYKYNQHREATTE